MNRRNFLKSFGIGLGALVLAPKMLFEKTQYVIKPDPFPTLLRNQKGKYCWMEGDELTKKLWAKSLWDISKERNYLGPFMSKKGEIEIYITK